MALESSWNHAHPGLWENILPLNWSLVPERLGPAELWGPLAVPGPGCSLEMVPIVTQLLAALWGCCLTAGNRGPGGRWTLPVGVEGGCGLLRGQDISAGGPLEQSGVGGAPRGPAGARRAQLCALAELPFCCWMLWPHWQISRLFFNELKKPASVWHDTHEQKFYFILNVFSWWKLII